MVSVSLGRATRGKSLDTMIWMLLMIQISFNLDVACQLYAPFQFQGLSVAVHVTSLGNRWSFYIKIINVALLWVLDIITESDASGFPHPSPNYLTCSVDTYYNHLPQSWGIGIWTVVSKTIYSRTLFIWMSTKAKIIEIDTFYITLVLIGYS